MQIEVDQSGKIGKTNEDTILAFSNGKQFTVLIPRSVKQRCLRELRNQGYEPHTIYLQMFVIGLYFLLREHMQRVALVIIDIEYQGYEVKIRRFLLNLLRRDGLNVDKTQIGFGYIGKDSPAHTLAISTYRKEKVARLVLTFEDIVREF